VLRRDPLANPEPLIRRVYAYVAYRLGDGPEAEDVTSTVFENAVRYVDTYDQTRGEPVAWLLGIARRCVAQALVGRQEPPLELKDEAAHDDVEAELIDRLMLQAALRNLSERDRELIALRYGADLRVRQIADLLGLKQNAAEVALHRALDRLRFALEEEEQDREPRLLDAPEGAV
jgi:RNA polymerase sigma-70 factor (ECF subfamily)